MAHTYSKNTYAVHVIDSDADVCNSLRLLLQSPQVQVISHVSAEAFLSQLNDLRPDCLVVDLHLPGISGLELLERLEASDVKVPTILLASHSDVPTAVHGMRSGAVDFIEKPFIDRKLASRVQQILRGRQNN